MNRLVVMICAVSVILAATGTVMAAPLAGPGISAMDITEGDRLAHTLCVNCHIVDARGPLLRTDRVPSFPWIAQQPGLSQDFLRVWLISSRSHERMPDFSLTREEIRQLSAYIFSLRASSPPSR